MMCLGPDRAVACGVANTQTRFEGQIPHNESRGHHLRITMTHRHAATLFASKLQRRDARRQETAQKEHLTLSTQPQAVQSELTPEHTYQTSKNSKRF